LQLESALVPYFTSIAYDADQIGVAVSTAIAGALGRIVIYGVGSLGMPDVKLFEGSSDFIMSATGYQHHDISANPFTFQSGTMYWLGLITSSTATIRAVLTSSCVNLGLPSNVAANYATTLLRVLPFADPLPDPWVFVDTDYALGNSISIRMRAV